MIFRYDFCILFARSSLFSVYILLIKAGLYSIWCGVNTLGDRHSAIVNAANQLLLHAGLTIAEWMASA